MKIIKTKIDQLFVIELESKKDSRGFFSTSYSKEILKKKDISFNVEESYISFNKIKGTLRGMHYQKNPYAQSKIMHCSKGSIYDVVIDLRKKSKTYGKWMGFKLSEKKLKKLLIPKGCAHGFQSLEDNSEVLYDVMGKYKRGQECGIRWNDSFFKIKWPLKVSEISEKDQKYADFSLGRQ